MAPGRRQEFPLGGKPSSFENSLCLSFARRIPSHVVCAWIGNSESVAQKFYLQTTDDHFAKAVQQPDVKITSPQEQTTQNPTQHSVALTRATQQTEKSDDKKTPDLPGFTALCDIVHKYSVPLRGFEHTEESSANDAGVARGDVNSDARSVSDLSGQEQEQILLYLASLQTAERTALMQLLRTLGRGQIDP
jgi:hypothetical protein